MTHPNVDEAITSTDTETATEEADSPASTDHSVSDKQKAAELETLPERANWSLVASGIILIGVFVAFFLWLGGGRCVRRLVKGGEANYSKLGSSDP